MTILILILVSITEGLAFSGIIICAIQGFWFLMGLNILLFIWVSGMAFQTFFDLRDDDYKTGLEEEYSINQNNNGGTNE